MNRQADHTALARDVRILHLEDDALDAGLVREFLRASGLPSRIDRVWTRDSFTEALVAGGYDIVLADHQLPDFDGVSALAIARDRAPGLPFIFVSGAFGEELAVEAMRHGATDYVVKQRLERLPVVVRRALAEAGERAERQRAEAALRQSEEQFRTLADNIDQFAWMADASGAIYWYNKRWFDYTGTTFDEMRGWGWRSVHHPDHLERVEREFRRCVESGSVWEDTFPLRGRDGGYCWFLSRARPITDANGRIVRWFGTNTDVTAQREVDATLRRLNESLEQRVVAAITEREAMLAKLHESQKLETIGHLTGGFAHDFNNLLTPILGNLDLLRRRLSENDRSQRLIASALQGAERAKTLVQRLLAFARRQVLEARPVDVAKLVDGMADFTARSIGPQISLAIEAQAGLPAARVDPTQLELAILNLAVNSRDAMPDGGRLTIAVDLQTVGPGHHSGLRHGEFVRVSVTDTGTGMDPATLARAIEPFYSTKGIGKGTGLGLSMVHGLAAQSGGTLLMSSTPGAGTRAEIWLPVANEQADSHDPTPHEPMRGDPVTILLVDDEQLVRATTASMLSDLGHCVIEAGSGAQALDCLGRLTDGSRPDLVITDYLMPAMNGAELAREIRARHPNLPILLATGYASLTGNAMADLPLLPKPFQQAELAATIERLMQRPQATEEAMMPPRRRGTE
ncbi:response regulator [Rhodoplanes roseus]|uniref:response regulator n=1 Tax=Rhodoplanes roseus TaxID=29409 RepID=UPI001473CC1A|nr:response regulator [Rhodoplanes roseus]